MYVIRDSSGNIWVQGEGGGGENPSGITTDRKNAWYKETALSGDFVRPLMTHGTINQSDNLGYFTKTDGSVTISGNDASGLTSTPDANGSGQSGSPPFDVLGGSQDIFFASGNVNRFIVAYQA